MSLGYPISNEDKTAIENTKFDTLDVLKPVVGVNAFTKIKAYPSSNKVLADGTSALLELNTVLFDSLSEWDATNYRFTAYTPGYYLVIGQLYWSDGGNGVNTSSIIKKNGTTIARANSGAGADAGNYQQVSAIVKLNINDYIELWAANGFTSSRQVDGGVNDTYISITRLL